ncbi:MAG: hypothetical protein ABI680_05670 [Chthoniobacteraceae bacterium]
MPAPVSTRDLFAELYVAGLLADAGWHLYFPKRDYGFDFIATKAVRGSIVIRPVQVKGLYPTASKKSKGVYGYSGRLTQLHSDMVLAMPFFPTTREPSPLFTAFLPFCQARPRGTKPGQYYAFPASFRDGAPVMRRNFRRFFDATGLQLMETEDFTNAQPENG